MPKATSSSTAKTTAKSPAKPKTTTKKVPAKPKKEKLNSGKAEIKPGKSLVIVESPGKIKTISKYLGSEYTIKASIGHITGLADKNMSQLVANDFQPSYEVDEGKKKVVSELKQLVKTHANVIIATDEDREGEAIAYQLASQLKLPVETTPRIVFNEITEKAIKAAIADPRTIDMDMVEAQKGRAVLDKLVGFSISPILRSKVRRGLSAGRVQSVAVKLIVEKEKEINAFKPQEFWTLEAGLKENKEKINIYLKKLNNINTSEVQDGEDLETQNEDNKEDNKNLSGARFPRSTIDQVFAELGIKSELSEKTKQNKASKKSDSAKTDEATDKGSKSSSDIYILPDHIDFKLVDIIKKEARKTPSAPFVTSTLQQTASRLFNRPVKSVMSAAQKLYEAGLITYMRTDSTSLSGQAIIDINKYVNSKFGSSYAQERQFASKNKNAQEAHEAIRPTHIETNPESIKLGQYEAKLYDLIWRRTLASQMADAIFDATTYIYHPVATDNQTRQASGKVMKFEGWLKIMRFDEEDLVLPYIEKGDIWTSEEFVAKQNQTKPPARYTEATLVKTLENKGIGRPSTYASTIQTVQDRGYVVKDAGKLKPSEIAFSVNDFLETHFDKLMNYDFTALMEDKLDDIANGDLDRQQMLRDFYEGFETQLTNSKGSDRVSLAIGKICPKCTEGELVVRFAKGTNKQFVGCNRYPDCDYIESTGGDNDKLVELQALYEGKDCPMGGTILVKNGRFGPFLTSTLYPEVKWIKSPKQYEAENARKGDKPLCPNCSKDMVIRGSRRGNFRGCTDYPTCNGIVNIVIEKKD